MTIGGVPNEISTVNTWSLADVLVLVARSALALVFLTAGALKVASGADAGDTMARFGFRGPVWEMGGRWLPILEIAVGVALIFPQTAVAGGLLSVILLGAFTAVMVAALRRGEAPPCNCFGALTAAPISRRTVARNLVLLALALIALTLMLREPGPSLLAWTSSPALASEGLALVSLLLAVALFAVGRTLFGLMDAHRSLEASVASLERRPGPPQVARDAPPVDDGLPLGAPAPAFALSTAEGSPITLRQLLDTRRAVLLVAASASCGPCRALAPQIREWSTAYRDRLTILIAYAGGAPDPGTFGPHVIVTGSDDAMIKSYRLQWTPTAVLIDRHGTIASPVAAGAESISRLVGAIAASPEPSPEAMIPHYREKTLGLPIGSAAPMLPIENGNGPHLLLFWRLGCPYCQGIFAALERWIAGRADRPADAVSLVVVNWGQEPNVGLEGVPVVEDASGDLARQFGAPGTPAAVIVDANGRVASTIGVGPLNVLALLGERT